MVQSKSRMPVILAGLLASGAFIVPTALSASTAPSPNHPRTLLWYRSLRQPPFKPPDVAVPVAWIAIESTLALAAFRLLRAQPSAARSRALGWLAWNVGMIGGWSRLFFGRKALAVSTVAAASMVASGVMFSKEAREVDPVAADAGLPFTTWVAFATILTASIWALNRRR